LAGGGSQQWKASTGTLLEQCTKLEASVLLLAWGRASVEGAKFCLVSMADLDTDGRTRLSVPSGGLSMSPDALDKGWGFGKAARVCDARGLEAALESAFQRYSRVDRTA
jgi:hypothetical protein